MKKTTFLSLVLCLEFVPVFGTVLNPNADMELGEIGKPVPAWLSIFFQVSRDVAIKNPSKKFSALTTKDGREGKGLVCLPDQGTNQYRLSCPKFYIYNDSEVEISLDSRIGKRSDGKPVKVSIGVDFRSYGDDSIENTEKKNWDRPPKYPVLKTFSIRPKTEWTTVTKRFKVRGWYNFYSCWVTVNMGENQVPVYLDNIRIRILDGKNDHPQEAMLIPDHGNCAYFHGEKMNFRLNARLNDSAEKIDGNLVIYERESKKVWKEVPVTLKKREDKPQNGLSLYSADVTIPADRYGVFKSELDLKQTKLPLYGQFSVVHQLVRHPRWSPGWGIGMNMHVGTFYVNKHKDWDKFVNLNSSGSWSNKFSMARLAGMNCARIWCYPKDVYADEDHYRTKIIGPLVEELKKNDIEIFMMLCGFKVFYNRGPNPERSEYPPFLYKYYVKMPGPGRIIYMLDCPERILRNYYGFVLKNWGKDIHFWELYNEPGVRASAAPVYLKHLKFAYALIKSFDKNHFVLGNGNTGDVGFDSGWFRVLNKVDPDYVDYLDGIAFHPYHNSLDFLKNSYGYYSEHIRQIRESLKKDRPLFNTECFYVTNGRKPQLNFGENLHKKEPEAVVRHYVEGMINQVKAAHALAEKDIREPDAGASGEECLSTEATVTNALSAMLKGMARVERIDMGRSMNAGIFTSENRKEALGVIYDMKPGGSKIVFKSSNGLRFFDIYGNPLEKVDGEKLEYEALYLKGSEAAVRGFFKDAKFIPGDAAPVFAKVCDGRAYLSILNTLGILGEVEIRFAEESGLPNVCFDFHSKTSDAVNDIPLPPEGIKTGTPYSIYAGGVLIASGKLNVLPVSAVYFAGSKADAKPLKLSDGSTAEIWNENGNFCFKVQVKQDKIQAPTQNNAPWTGDAVELFFDPAPFDNVRANQIIGTVPLNCFQYGFSAKPAPDGNNMAVIRRTDPKFTTKASAKSTLTDDGYIMEGSIPLAEIAPVYGDVMGFEIAINRPGKSKESLSGMKKQAHKERGHYPLFKIVREPFVKNFDFSQGEFGDADYWQMPKQAEHNTSRMVPGAGMYGKNAIVFQSTKKLWNGRVELSQRCKIPENANYIRAAVLVKIESISAAGNPMWHPQGFFIRFDVKADMSHDRKKCYRDPINWTRFQYVSKLTEAQKKKGFVDIYTGIRQGTGSLKIAEFNIDFMEK